MVSKTLDYNTFNQFRNVRQVGNRSIGTGVVGYNSTESEPIWMKFGVLLLHYLRLVLADFRRDLRSCVAEEGGEILFFFVR